MFQELVQTQRDFFNTHQTKNIQYRKEALKKLRQSILNRKDEILQALHEDLGKHPLEGYMAEVVLVLEEIKHALKDIDQYAKPKRVVSPITHFMGKSEVYYEPYGVVLVISPWNYPFALSMTPLIGAIASGNCVILKPSSYSKKTEEVMCKIIKDCFEREYVCVVCGGHQEVQGLLEEHLDYIFFTGSVQVGKIIMEKASKHLTPVTLELGGKNPCIIDSSADLDLAVKRVIWAKFFNCGQTCIAPDYVLVHQKFQSEFFAKAKKQLEEYFGADPMVSENFGKIITQRHYERAKSLLDIKVGEIYGGRCDDEAHKIEPTMIDFGSLSLTHPALETPMMQDEIFAPFMPVFFYQNLQECIDLIHSFQRPLALYLFTQDKGVEQRIIKEISYGGGCINDCIMHIANPNLPFGGVGYSGMGSYHGKANFETFSHKKSIYHSPKFEIPLRYPPFDRPIFGIARRKLLDFLFAR